MKFVFSWCVCVLAIFLPWRLRIWLADALGWGAQGLYGLYFKIFRVLLKHASKKDRS